MDQVIEHMLSMKEAQGSTKLGIVVYECNPSTGEVEKEESEVQGHL